MNGQNWEARPKKVGNLTTRPASQNGVLGFTWGKFKLAWRGKTWLYRFRSLRAGLHEELCCTLKFQHNSKVRQALSNNLLIKTTLLTGKLCTETLWSVTLCFLQIQTSKWKNWDLLLIICFNFLQDESFIDRNWFNLQPWESVDTFKDWIQPRTGFCWELSKKSILDIEIILL